MPVAIAEPMALESPISSMMPTSPEAAKPQTAIAEAEAQPRSHSNSSSNGKRSPTEHSTRPRRHKQWYMWDGNIVIQVENTLFRLKLSTLHEASPIFRNIVPPIKSGSLPVVGFNDRRPLLLYEVSQVDFVRLLPMLYPSSEAPEEAKTPSTILELFSILKLATNFQMEGVRHAAMLQLLALPMDPVRRIALWEEFHLDADLLLPSFATLCQRSEPLTLPMTMALGIRTFTKVAAARDLYRQRVGCCTCRQSLSEEESQAIAEKVVTVVFAKAVSPIERPML